MTFENFLITVEKSLPRLVRDADLAKLGIISKAQLSIARRAGNGCPFMKVRGRVIYFREDVIQWIKSQYHAAPAVSE